MVNKPLIKHITDFLEYCEVEKGLTPITAKNYWHFLNKFAEWLKDKHLSDLTPRDLSPDHIWEYRLYLSRKSLKKATQSYYLIALRALLAYFVEKDIPSLAPNKIKLPKDGKSRSVKFLNLDQLKRLLDSPDINTIKGVRDKAILETFFSAGLRVAELTSLNIEQVGAGLRDKKNKDLEIMIKGKGGAHRVVFFSERCLSYLEKYLGKRTDIEPALFVNLKKNPARLTIRSIQRIVKQYAIQAGIPLLATPHTLRHTYATDLLNQGVDLRLIQEFLGHKNIATTQVYTHVTNKKLREIHRQFHSGGKLD